MVKISDHSEKEIKSVENFAELLFLQVVIYQKHVIL